MTDSLPDPPDLDPAALAASDFTRTRRGLEPTEVRATLGRAADALRTWGVRDERHRAELERLTVELAGSRELDESRIVSVLGEETARIVAAAREAAEEIRAKAEEQAARLLAETESDATTAAEALRSEARLLLDEAQSTHDGAVAEAERLQSEAAAAAEELLGDATLRSEEMISASTSVLAERTAEADAHAAEIEATATAVLEEAHAAAAGVRAAAETDASATVAAAREQGRQMIDEVKAARERMLVDLAERRRAVRRQLEGALAGRDRIAEVLRETGVRVEEAIAGLDAADGAASEAAERAAAALTEDAELDELREQLAASEPEPIEESTVVLESVEVVEVVEIVAFETGVAEEELTEVPAETIDTTATTATTATTSETADTAAEDDGDDDETDGGSDDDSSSDPGGATVHDLFERIRTSELADGDLGDATAEPDETEIDLTNAPETPSSAEGELFDRRDEALVPIEKSLSRGLKRLASDEQNQILDRLRRVKRGRPDPVEILPAAEVDDEAVWIDALMADFGLAVDSGAAFWAELTGASTGQLFDDDTARDVLAERVRGFLALHRAHLERVFSDSEERGDDVSELADKVRAAYRDWRSSSLPELAGDLATAGFTHGERRAAGPGTPWRWLVDNGGLPCADGEDNALGGAVACDEPFPTGDVTPPAHPGCRCILAPADR